ncbi:MAG: hypothetical protein HZB21_00885 [Deltaproteobacteria bacterium]|nr:hypothetical protein [Deltaproteobacteria bacterium]
MAGFIVITGPGHSRGFRCAGFDCMEAVEDEVSGLLLSIQDKGRYGLVAVEERLLMSVTDAVMRRIRKRGLPVIMHINMPEKWEEREPGESPVVRLIRKAIGYQIKIKR